MITVTPSASRLQSAIRNPQSAIPTRVLIIGPSNIGDAILTSDVIAAVRDRFPEAHVALVVGERATALFVEDPRIQTLVDADRFDSPLGRLRLAWALWRYRPHVIVDLRHTLYPLLLKPWAAWRYLRRPPKALTHMRERHLWKLRVQVPGLKERSGFRVPGSGYLPRAQSPEPRALWYSAKDISHVEGLGKRWGLDGSRRLVIVCPGARSHIKRWTAEGFARVADRLITEARAQVVFSGEPDEGPVIEEILALMGQRAHSAVGQTTIRQLGALMSRSRLVIANDSASLHVASALGVPMVAIFGPTDAAKYGPTSPQSRVVRRRLFCAPCEQPLCRFNHECMRFITPDEVYDAARQLLDGVASSEQRAASEDVRKP
ncbi:MAG: glycosyltransferase family 9 protein [Candidatus Omnitrophica bacterium]|nr:glycosyltransferase family 9 protein [Candidatus Omnitrophota bacterium]